MRWTRRTETDFSNEVRAHIALEADRLVADGMNRDDAEAAARRTFGNLTSAHERFYESRRLLWLDQLGQDLRAGARSLRRYPVAAAVALLSLGAGIGATTASLTIRNVLFENSPPLYERPEQLSKIQVEREDRLIMPIASYVPGDLYVAWRGSSGVPMAASMLLRGPRDVRTAERVEATPIRRVTADFFPLLGVRPLIGNVFPAQSGQAGESHAVLSYSLWQQWFDGRPDAVGTTIWIDNRPHVVIGVMPERFWFSEMSSPIWTLLEPGTLTADDRLQIVVRRPDRLSGAALAARLRGSLAEYSRRLPPGQRALQLRVSAIKGTPVGDQMSFLLPYLLGTCVFLTLLIACTNVAVLMIAQWTTREAETALRAALGASRWRIVRALVAESVVLAVCAGTLGICVTFVLRGILISRSGPAAWSSDLSIDTTVLLQSSLIAILTGIVAGIGPALFETRRMQANPLRGIAVSDRIRQRWSRALVVFEITVTLALLVVTMSMIDQYQQAAGAELGFGPARLMVASVENPGGIPTTQLIEALGQIPGIAAVEASTAVPLAGRGPRQQVSADSTGVGSLEAERISIGPEFFSTLGVPIRAGRAFTNQDSPLTRIAIVNEALARQLFDNQAPIGRQVWVAGAAYDVVGLAANYASRPVEYRVSLPKLFLPLATAPQALKQVRFLVRANGDPIPLVQRVRRALLDASPGTVVATDTLPQILSVQSKEMLIGTAPLVPLIVIGMLLTSSGIYSVLAFAIARRSREIAVRVAIGASRRDQLRLVTMHSLRLVGLGSAIGIGLTFGLSRVVRAVGGAGSYLDPKWPAFVWPVLIVFVIAALATWIPTRRALRINPAQLLRTN
ncbi:MAG TPA: ABC transporter permease [Vicinamibacterales bacterium]|nr:ABC transporter permease [Vicinamibacterales bacterium]